MEVWKKQNSFDYNYPSSQAVLCLHCSSWVKWTESLETDTLAITSYKSGHWSVEPYHDDRIIIAYTGTGISLHMVRTLNRTPFRVRKLLDFKALGCEHVYYCTRKGLARYIWKLSNVWWLQDLVTMKLEEGGRYEKEGKVQHLFEVSTGPFKPIQLSNSEQHDDPSKQLIGNQEINNIPMKRKAMSSALLLSSL